MNGLKVYFLPVGQGDSTYIELPNGQKMLVDINYHLNHGIDVVRFLKDRIPEVEDNSGKRTRKLDYLVITHAHEDHIKGLEELDREFVFGEIWDSGHDYDYGEDLWQQYRKLIRKYDKKGLVRRRKASSEPFSIGQGHTEVYFHVLSPSSYISTKNHTDQEKREAIHTECMVLRMSFRNFSILLASDSNKECWERINKYYADILPSDFLHASHHGSRSFFKKNPDDEEPLIEHLMNINPKYLVVSVSHPSKHDHPHKDAMKLYREVVKKENILYTETSETCTCYILHINDKESYSLVADEELANHYLLKQEEKRFNTRTHYYVNIGARVGKRKEGPFGEAYPSKGRSLEKDLWIRFHIEGCNVPKPYGVLWEVKNTGYEAKQANDLDHSSGPHYHGDPEYDAHIETTRYKGMHSLDCVIVKNGHEVCRSRYWVNIQ